MTKENREPSFEETKQILREVLHLSEVSDVQMITLERRLLGKIRANAWLNGNIIGETSPRRDYL